MDFFRSNNFLRPETTGLSAAELAAKFRSGWFPPPIQVSFALEPNEACVGVTNGELEQWLEGDGTYIHKSVAWAGSLTGLALGGALNAIGNARRRAQAAHKATERWRHIGTFRIYVTTARIALDGGYREWHDFWYSNFRTLDYDQTGVILQSSGNTACRLRITPPDYWYVGLRKLAFGEVNDAPMS